MRRVPTTGIDCRHESPARDCCRMPLIARCWVRTPRPPPTTIRKTSAMPSAEGAPASPPPLGPPRTVLPKRRHRSTRPNRSQQRFNQSESTQALERPDLVVREGTPEVVCMRNLKRRVEACRVGLLPKAELSNRTPPTERPTPWPTPTECSQGLNSPKAELSNIRRAPPTPRCFGGAPGCGARSRLWPGTGLRTNRTPAGTGIAQRPTLLKRCAGTRSRTSPATAPPGGRADKTSMPGARSHYGHPPSGAGALSRPRPRAVARRHRTTSRG